MVLLVSVVQRSNYNNMKSLIALLSVATYCMAAEVPYTPAGSNTRSGLLLLPLQQARDSNNNATSTTPRSVVNGTANLEEVNARLTERLKQEQGSQEGVYHVYLHDGRLQRVQYITAPIVSAQQTQQEQAASYDYNQQQQQQTPEILSPEFAERRGVYFVQVPQERIQVLQANAQQVSQQSHNVQPSASDQYLQDSASPVNVRYLPLEYTPAQPQSPASQYRQEPAEEVPVVRYLPVPLKEEAQQYSRQSSGTQAVLQYTEVQPIQGPVYSYRPEGLTRILRYAPVY